MSIKTVLKAVYKRFPPQRPASHPVYLTEDGALHLCLVKDGQFYPFTIPDSLWNVSPDDFVAKIEEAASDAGILDILDSKL